MTDKLRKVTLYPTEDRGKTHYRILEHPDTMWVGYTEYTPGCYRAVREDYGYKRTSEEYVIPEKDRVLIDGVNCEVIELGCINDNRQKAKRAIWKLTKRGHKMAQKNVPVEHVVEGIKSLSHLNRATFVGSLESESRAKIADYLGVENSRNSILTFLNDEHSMTEKMTKLIDPLESLLEELKDVTKKKRVSENTG